MQEMPIQPADRNRFQGVSNPMLFSFSVHLIANYWMAQVVEMNADLVSPSRTRQSSYKCEAG